MAGEEGQNASAERAKHAINAFAEANEEKGTMPTTIIVAQRCIDNNKRTLLQRMTRQIVTRMWQIVTPMGFTTSRKAA